MHAARFEPPTIKQRGLVANAMAAVQAHKPPHGECSGTIPCTCGGGTLRYSIQSNGISRGQCSAARCFVRWAQ